MSNHAAPAPKPVSEPGNPGWPSTTGKPSGPGRINNPPKPKK